MHAAIGDLIFLIGDALHILPLSVTHSFPFGVVFYAFVELCVLCGTARKIKYVRCITNEMDVGCDESYHQTGNCMYDCVGEEQRLKQDTKRTLNHA